MLLDFVDYGPSRDKPELLLGCGSLVVDYLFESWKLAAFEFVRIVKSGLGRARGVEAVDERGAGYKTGFAVVLDVVDVDEPFNVVRRRLQPDSWRALQGFDYVRAFFELLQSFDRYLLHFTLIVDEHELVFGAARRGQLRTCRHCHVHRFEAK